MQIIIDRIKDGYLVTATSNEITTDNFESQILCRDFNELIKNLSISLENKYITVETQHKIQF